MAINSNANDYTVIYTATFSEIDKPVAEALEFLQGFRHVIDKRFNDMGLTHTQKFVALLLISGASYQDISQYLGKAHQTVKRHRMEIYQRAGNATRCARPKNAVQLLRFCLGAKPYI